VSKKFNIILLRFLLSATLTYSSFVSAESFDFADPLTPSSQNDNILEQRLQEKFQLQGVFKSEQVSYVIINGITLMAGDQIAGYTVTSITAEEIKLSPHTGREIAIRPYRFSLDKPRILFTGSDNGTESSNEH